MDKYLKPESWIITEDKFNAENLSYEENIFHLCNGRIGQKGNFVEFYSGKSLCGSYITNLKECGYPDNTLFVPDWMFIDVYIDNIQLDLAQCTILDYKRMLNMKNAYVERIFTVVMSSGKEMKVRTKRFLSTIDTEIAAEYISITPVNFGADITYVPLIKSNNIKKAEEDDELGWEVLKTKAYGDEAYLLAREKSSNFYLGIGNKYELKINDNVEPLLSEDMIQDDNFTGHSYTIHCHKGQQIVFNKYIAVLSSCDHCIEDIMPNTQAVVKDACEEGFYNLLLSHSNKWKERWENTEIEFDNNIKSQQETLFRYFDKYQKHSEDYELKEL